MFLYDKLKQKSKQTIFYKINILGNIIHDKIKYVCIFLQILFWNRYVILLS